MAIAHDKPTGVSKAQTIKQAKASYKARGRPTLTDAELKQLKRNVQLEQRAESLKEREKRRAEAAKKKSEKDREEARKHKAWLGSQVKCDRFGHKSSQFHLGKFFGGGQKMQDRRMEVEEQFGDDGLDDDSLLSALSPDPEETTLVEARPVTTQKEMPRLLPVAPKQGSGKLNRRSDAAKMPPPPLPKAKTLPAHSCAEDFSMFLDELDSGTQIAREINAEHKSSSKAESQPLASSFESGDFDLTMEDIAEIESPAKQQGPPEPVRPKPPPRAPPSLLRSNSNTTADRKAMPPPRLPTKAQLLDKLRTANPPPVQFHPESSRETPRSTIPPPVPRSYANNGSRGLSTSVPKKPLPAPFRPASDLVNSENTSEPDQRNSTTAKRIPPNTAIVTTTNKPSRTQHPQPQISFRRCNPTVHLGFTMSQLETCFEDDIQLTQVGDG